MSERKTLPHQTTHGGTNDSSQRLAHPLGGVPTNGNLVDSSNSSNPCYLGPFRLSPVAKQALVAMMKEVSPLSNKTRHNKHRKQGRPASSSHVRLSPQFRNPVDIERLGKALVAIAIKQTVKPNTTTNDDNQTTEASDAVDK
jgi:hypothetical protein